MLTRKKIITTRSKCVNDAFDAKKKLTNYYFLFEHHGIKLCL